MDDEDIEEFLPDAPMTDGDVEVLSFTKIDPEDETNMTYEEFLEREAQRENEMRSGVPDLAADHFKNLAVEGNGDVEVPSDKLREISSEVINGVEGDLSSRSEHIEGIRRGIGALGLGISKSSNKPFQGASSAHHPLLLESGIKYQSKLSKSLLSPDGPVDIKILDDSVTDILPRTDRYKEKFNQLLMYDMPSYVEEHDRALLQLVFMGSVFKKVRYDNYYEETVSDVVPVQDFIVSQMTTDLRRAPRFTHRLYKTDHELKRDIQNGLYTDERAEGNVKNENNETELQPAIIEHDAIRQAQSKLIGDSDIQEEMEVHVLYETYCYLDLEDTGEYNPYVVTVHKDTGTVLSIRRNWGEVDDNKRRPLIAFVHYRLIPGFGFLGLGLIHLLGNTQLSLTAILRSIIDSGQFANLQAGFKRKGLKIPNADEPLAPGEFRELDLMGGDKVGDAIYPMPFKEPSQTLYSMLSWLTQAGQKFADNLEDLVGKSANYGKVGTTLALMEESAEFFSSMFMRVYRAQREEFIKIAQTASEQIGPEFSMDFDRDGVIDIMPSADPSYPTKAHRLTLAQTKLNLALQSPDSHNLREAYHEFYQTVGMSEERINRILPRNDDAPKAEPMEDIKRASAGEPIKAYPGQDHDSHIAIKSMFLQDPSLGGAPVVSQVAGPVLQANIREHVVLKHQEMVNGTADQLQQQNPDIPREMAEQEAARMVMVANQQAQQNPKMSPEEMTARARMMEAMNESKEVDADIKREAFETILKAIQVDTERKKAMSSINKDGESLKVDLFKNNSKLRLDALKAMTNLEIQKYEALANDDPTEQGKTPESDGALRNKLTEEFKGNPTD